MGQPGEQPPPVSAALACDIDIRPSLGCHSLVQSDGQIDHQAEIDRSKWHASGSVTVLVAGWLAGWLAAALLRPTCWSPPELAVKH